MITILIENVKNHYLAKYIIDEYTTCSDIVFF